jgi:hypothetical protein
MEIILNLKQQELIWLWKLGKYKFYSKNNFSKNLFLRIRKKNVIK